MRDVAMNR